MHAHRPRCRTTCRPRAQQGQTLIVALLVLILLSFVGALFVTLVARNLQNAGRQNRVLNADFYAQAGVQYADQQLTYSPDGADWRPPVQYKLADATRGANSANSTNDYRPPTGSRERARYDQYLAYLTTNGTPLGYVPANDPDKAYLEQGFARYNIGGGRFLIRVSYDPAGVSIGPAGGTTVNKAAAPINGDPTVRYLKIESVGRVGNIEDYGPNGPHDPTTYQNVPPTRLSATLVAYKAIGITDYARFETNPDRRSNAMSLGVPSVFYTNGSSQDPNNQTATGIVTPGVFDFNTSPATPDYAQFPLATVYGAEDAYLQDANGNIVPNPLSGSSTNQNLPPGFTAIAGGGSIRANGSLTFFGVNRAFLNTPSATNFPDKLGLTEKIEVAGDLLLDNYNPANALVNPDKGTGQQNATLVYETGPSNAVGNTTTPVAPSNAGPTDPSGPFNTYSGVIRDGASGTDVNGYPRSVSRLEPPRIDSTQSGGALPRYRGLAQNSVARINQAQSSFSGSNANPDPNAPPYAGNVGGNPAQYGYGRIVYVDNTSDVQNESGSSPGGIIGGRTLPDEWLNRNSQYWVGSYYVPPAVDVTLGRQTAVLSGQPTTFYGLRLTRSDKDSNGNPVLWKNPNGTPLPDPNAQLAAQNINDDGTTPTTMTVSYASLGASTDPTNAQTVAASQNPNNDVVVYCEGNLRVHGIVSADQKDTSHPTSYGSTDDQLPRHVTLITNGTAYIDGNLLKGNPASSITVLARNYVCVNTTQFFAGPQTDQDPRGRPAPASAGGGLPYLDFTPNGDELVQEVNFGLPGTNPTQAYGTATIQGPTGAVTSPIALYVTGAPSAPGGPAIFDFDFGDPRTGQSIFNTAAAPLESIGPAQRLSFNTVGGTQGATPIQPANGLGTTVTGYVVPIPATTPDITTATQSQVFDLYGALDPSSTQDFYLQKMAVLPMDIRIEAVLYAQNRSFFVLPGDWFNTSTDDSFDAYRQQLVNNAGLVRNNVSNVQFPLYGQPIDLRITIAGSVSEARPAEVSAQAAWMQKWGWIPQYHGTSPDRAGHKPPNFNNAAPNQPVPPAAGLQIIYDPLAGYPYYYDVNTAANSAYLRSDKYGRPLPFTPDLPVSPGLLYSGQTTEQPILQ